MKAVGIVRYGGPDVLEVIEQPTPHAGRGQVRIRVHAAAVSPADTLIRSGAVQGAFLGPPPWIPGLEAAGVIDETGAGTPFRSGDRVMALVNPTRPAGGAYAEWIVLPASHVVRAPAGATHEQAATIPLSGLTARRALEDLALPPGAVVAVTGAAGAVGGHAVQLAKAHGLTVVADAAPADVELVKGLGADYVVPRGPRMARQVTRVAPGGADGIIDAALIGGSLLPALRDGGALAMLRQPDELGSPGPVPVTRGIRVHYVFVHEDEGRPDHLDRLRVLAEKGDLAMRVARTYPMAGAGDAHRALAAGGVRGRIVIDFA